MTDDKKDLSKDVAATAAGIGAVLLPPVAAPLAFLPLLVGSVIPAFLTRKERQARAWFDIVVNEEGAESAIASEIKQRLVDDPVAQEVVVEAFRTLLDAITPEVTPALGLLTRHYLHEQRPFDDFGRGLARMLADLTSEDFLNLRQLLSILAACQHVGRLNLIIAAPGENQPVQVAIAVPVSGGGRPRNDYLGEIPGSLRLFWLLKNFGLGQEGAAGYLGSVSGPHVLRIEKATVESIRTFVQ